MRQYGGVNNKKSINEIQEAVIVNAPVFRSKPPKTKAGALVGWLVYYFVTFIIMSLLVVITGIFEQSFYRNLPFFIQTWLIPSLPFILTLIYAVYKIRKLKWIRKT